MNKSNENKLVMMNALLSFLKKNQSIWQNSAPFAEAVAELGNLITSIEALRQSTDVDQSGLVAEKRMLKANLVNMTFEVSSQIYAMAVKTKNQVLQIKVDFTKSELEGQRDGELASTSKTVSELGRENLGTLVTYSITTAELDALNELINLYESSLPTRRLSVTERKASNDNMRGLFRSSKVLLNDQIKRMMVRYQDTNPKFYAGYLNTSTVVDYGTRYEKPDEPEAPQ